MHLYLPSLHLSSLVASSHPYTHYYWQRFVINADASPDTAIMIVLERALHFCSSTPSVTFLTAASLPPPPPSSSSPSPTLHFLFPFSLSHSCWLPSSSFYTSSPPSYLQRLTQLPIFTIPPSLLLDGWIKWMAADPCNVFHLESHFPSPCSLFDRILLLLLLQHPSNI